MSALTASDTTPAAIADVVRRLRIPIPSEGVLTTLPAQGVFNEAADLITALEGERDEARKEAQQESRRAYERDEAMRNAQTTANLMARRWKDSENVRGDLASALLASRAENDRLREACAVVADNEALNAKLRLEPGQQIEVRAVHNTVAEYAERIARAIRSLPLEQPKPERDAVAEGIYDEVMGLMKHERAQAGAERTEPRSGPQSSSAGGDNPRSGPDWWRNAASSMQQYVDGAIFPEHWHLSWRIAIAHMQDMLRQMLTPGFDRDKALVWLGWLQGALEATGNVEPEQLNVLDFHAKADAQRRSGPVAGGEERAGIVNELFKAAQGISGLIEPALARAVVKATDLIRQDGLRLSGQPDAGKDDKVILLRNIVVYSDNVRSAEFQYSLAEAREFINRLAAAPKPPALVPEPPERDWLLMPRAPTSDMLNAGADEFKSRIGNGQSLQAKCASIYEAMLNRSPRPPEPAPIPAPASRSGTTMRDARLELRTAKMAMETARHVLQANHYTTDYLTDALAIIADALAAPDGMGWRPTHRHKKRGVPIRFLHEATFQIAGDSSIKDEENVIVYEHEDGGWWARPAVEFNDGRFEPISAKGETG